MTVTELQTKTRGYGLDANNRETASRVWFVDTYDRDTAIYALGQDGVTIGSAFPDRNTLKLDSFSVSPPVGAGVEVTALYSSDRRFAPIPPPDKLNPTWYRLTSTSRETEREYPYLEYRSVAVPGNPNGARAWTVTKRKLIEAVGEFSVSVVVDAWSVERENYCTSQVGLIHVIAGRQSLFMGHQLNAQINASSQQYEVQYTWSIDPGTRAFPAIDDPRVILPPERPPFWEYTTRVIDDPSVQAPTPYAFQVRTTNANGWQGLPGMVPL